VTLAKQQSQRYKYVFKLDWCWWVSLAHSFTWSFI